MLTSVEEGMFEGQPAFVLESEQTRAIVLPRIGGKVAALIDKTTGQDLLWHTPGRRYRYRNPSAYPMRYIRAAHPLFRVRPGMRIALPAGIRVRVDSSRDERLTTSLDDMPWLASRDAQGQLVRLDQIGEPTLCLANKLFTTALQEGWCGLHEPEPGQTVAFSFDPCRLPYVGIDKEAQEPASL